MKFRVHISDKALADLDEVLAWLEAQLASEASERWFATIWNAIDTLETNPQRCSLAAESEDFGLDIRELLVGRRRGRYRILFQIRDNSVQILRIWHGARSAIESDDL